LVLLLVLGGGQGALGWYMVQSGLIDVPEVSHYRLAAHLSMALLLFSLVWWTALDLLTRAPRKPATLNHRIIVWSFLGVLALQIVYGAFVAGLDAGYAYGTWPDMEGQFVPDEAFAGNTLWQRLTYGQGTVQFIHRMLAYGVAVFAVIIALTFPQHLADKPARLLARALVFVVLGQVVLGILTLLQGVPVFLGTLHQGWAVILLGVTVTLLHRLRQP
ncbi:MAG: COX15/CtaA family protein, partial [Pseudomonadota bacterium]